MDSKPLLQQNPPVLNWGCRITQVDQQNGCKTVVCVCECVHIKTTGINSIYAAASKQKTPK